MVSACLSNRTQVHHGIFDMLCCTLGNSNMIMDGLCLQVSHAPNSGTPTTEAVPPSSTVTVGWMCPLSHRAPRSPALSCAAIPSRYDVASVTIRLQLRWFSATVVSQSDMLFLLRILLCLDNHSHRWCHFLVNDHRSHPRAVNSSSRLPRPIHLRVRTAMSNRHR